MLFFIDDYNDLDKIPDIYKILVMGEKKYPLNRPNAIDFTCMVPEDVDYNDNGNKRRYLRQIKDNELMLVMNMYGNRASKMAQAGQDINSTVTDNIVFVCDGEDIEDFNYMKLFRKFIKKKYGMKVFRLTYDITLDMIEESKMSEEGRIRYTNKLIKLNEGK